MKPQSAYILRCLRTAGERGVTSNYFRREGVNYIADPPTRISELKKLGYEISSTPIRTEGGSTCRLYRLLKEAPPAESSTGPESHGDSPVKGQSPRARLVGGVSPPRPPESLDDESPAPVGTLFDDSEFKPKPRHDRVEAA